MLTYGDKENHFSGSYTGYLSPWGADRAVHGIDYLQTMTVDEAAFPNKTVFDFSWPASPVDRVRSYNHVAFGNLRHTSPPDCVRSIQVAEIGTLCSHHDMSLDGYLEGFGVIYDLFLTRSPGDFDDFSIEVMVNLHTPASALMWFNTGKLVSGYNEGTGRIWDLRTINNIIVFTPQNAKSVLKASINLGDMLRFLALKGIISGEEFYNGHGIGVEPRNFAGRMTLNEFSVDYG